MSIDQISNWLVELDKLKLVHRKTKTIGLARYENSAEHSWQIALFALAMHPYAAEPVSIDHVVRMLLVHDVGEIDAGDVMVFAHVDAGQREAEESAGVRRVFSLLPSPMAEQFISLWQEFEAASTPEARFAHAIDRAIPIFINLANQGQSWRENNISYERVIARVRTEVETGCPALWAHLEPRLRHANANGWFGSGQ